MKTFILGAGLSGLSTAYFLQKDIPEDEIFLLEKEAELGGLCRTIQKNGYLYDIGPHILFSKDKEMLELLLSVLDKKNKLKRSNRILYKGIHIQYPFENDLSKLPEKDLQYCIDTFNSNPYETYEVSNMLQFFLKTFGEGITNCYLRPYNEKIWKYDLSFMNTSMVDRIPKPTREEILRSAAGETVDGYIHQLYFSYPSEGGIQAIPDGFYQRLDKQKCHIETDVQITRIEKHKKQFLLYMADGKVYDADRLISTIPVPELTKIYADVPAEIQKRVGSLRYNSICIAFVRVPYDLCGENFTFTIPDKNVIFHRISKMDFLGDAYHRNDEATYIVEVTYRANDIVDKLSEEELRFQLIDGMVKIGFAKVEKDVFIIDIIKRQYAYIIYDLNHQQNMEEIRIFYQKENIYLNGRFGNFEYWNMDRILKESLKLSKYIAENDKK